VRIGLRELHVPENRRSELEDVPDVLSERRRLNNCGTRPQQVHAPRGATALVSAEKDDELAPSHCLPRGSGQEHRSGSSEGR
jgi:hypothetical protein